MSREELFFATLGLIRRNQVLTQMLDELGARYLGVNPTDGRAIDVIDQRGRITAGELARELRLSTGAVTTIVDRLERAGFARRVRDEQDRRRVLIEVTPIVGELSHDIYGSPHEVFDEFASAYTDEEAEVVYRFQKMSQEWLEDRLARVQALIQRKEADASSR
jgi:DNA-binding MarR family transcriptional regulator